MIAHQFEYHDFYFRQGLETLQKVETLIDEGRVGERFRSWVDSTKENYEKLATEVKKAREEQKDDDEEEEKTAEADAEAGEDVVGQDGEEAEGSKK